MASCTDFSVSVAPQPPGIGAWGPNTRYWGLGPQTRRPGGSPGGYGATDSEKSLQEAKWFLLCLDAASKPDIFQTILPNGFDAAPIFI